MKSIRLIFIKILKFVAYFVAACGYASLISRYINPGQFYISGLLTLTLLPLTVVNICLLSFHLLQFSRSLLVFQIGFACIFAVTCFHTIFHINQQPVEKQPQFSLVTFNVNVFNTNTSNPEDGPEMIAWAKNTAADILCFQEFHYKKRSKRQTTMALLQRNFNYVHESRLNVPGSSNFAIVTASAYPIIKDSVLNPGSHNLIFSTDHVINSDTIRVINCHLESYRLPESISREDQSSDQKMRAFLPMMKNMKSIFKLRTAQLKMISDYTATSPYPVIICGDFNSTPYSYLYHSLRKNYKNAHEECGNGTGFTLHYPYLPFFRIDHVFYSDELHCTSAQVRRDMSLSDHYPLHVHFGKK